MVNEMLLVQLIIILIQILVVIAGRHIVVTPSADDISGCGYLYNMSCMTLSQLTSANWIPTFNSSINLTFLQGHHQLNQSDFNLTGLQYVSMGSSSVKDQLKLKSTINCTSPFKLRFRFIKLLKISGLKFNGCLENEVISVGSFQMKNCHLIGDRNMPGRALIVNNSTLNLERSYFESFSNNGTYNGGAIYGLQSVMSITDCTFTNNTATSGGVLYVEGTSEVTIHSSTFNNNTATDGGTAYCDKGAVINISNSHFTFNKALTNGTFIDNMATDGGTAYCDKGAVINIFNSNFMFNKALENGGVIYQLDCDVRISRSYFSDNHADNQGGVIYHKNGNSLNASILILEDSSLLNNIALRGGVAFIRDGNVCIERCQFRFNKASDDGGALFLHTNTIATIASSNFSDNAAVNIAGAVRAMLNSEVTVLGFTLFERNSAFYGAAMHLFRAGLLTLNGTVSIINNVASFGCFSILSTDLVVNGNLSFVKNAGSLFAYSSDILLKGTVNFTRHFLETSGESVIENKAGCISLILSKLNMSMSSVSLSHSAAFNGGGLVAITSTIFIHKSEPSIKWNNVSDTGGGIYLYQSKMYVRGTVDISNNSAINCGGGIHAVSSTIVVHIVKVSTKYSNLYLASNSASKGGGIYLELNSQLYLTQLAIFELKRSPNKRFVFLINNLADYGGAIYVADETNMGTCSSGHQTTTVTRTYTECFFRLTSVEKKLHTIKTAIMFSGNVAYKSGSVLFGGLLDRCTVSSFVKYHEKYSNVPGFADGIANDTSSHPVKVCLCNPNETGNEICLFEKSEILRVNKGETFGLYVTAIDQMNHSVDATVNAYLSNTGSLEEGQRKRDINKTCSELYFTVYSIVNQETLTLYAGGPCKDVGISALKVPIHLNPCNCPPGFELNENFKNKCVCVCHKKLLSLAFLKELTCNSTTLTITRRKQFWISFENGQFIVYDRCPSDYCLPPIPPVNINLNSSDGADVQCNYNRSGKLCGQCQKGLTLSLGSSHCIECPPSWPANLVAIVIGTLLAGVLLVALLLLTNLTVAAGTLNGVIFYANVLSTSPHLYLPFQNPNFHSIFIAWLNLDLGFDVCFFKDMDTYVKTWLQIAFPIYLILVVIAIMLVSKYSLRFSQMISSKNPVATLATLILLFFTKLGDNSIIATLYVSLSYIPESEDDQYVEVLWANDASVPFLKGKHIMLYLVSIFVLLIGLIYTFLLLFWQWLVYLPNRSIFKWVRNTKLSSFIDAYHAPFTARNRYWTGLLLLARVIIHVTAAVSSKSSVNLLLISLTIGCIILLQGYSGVHIYKKCPLNILELTTYFNILAFTVAKFYVILNEGDHDAIAYISITVEFILFICVITYHVSIETNIVFKIKRFQFYKIHFSRNLCHPLLTKNSEVLSLVNRPSDPVTFSEVTLDNQVVDQTMKEREDATKLFSEEL